ncbi:GntR family transcriptional regulator [Halomonas dongshanensis]|uniref:GntR family transcriptional regulator n=1 Tax=Halomonas dongshanensis TaxID=2890835 RepID=A0ABT2EDH8_9GAMM|nr:GntR family transcriptional regulator [Halomonas dongshanensis]MCS2609610.1 GntR family transcriptional regulator [Halomonas dongshanensis]
MSNEKSPMPSSHGRSGKNLLELAYQSIEELIVTCKLKPGTFLRIQDLQELTGFNRMPVYQAVTRLSTDTLLIIQPRQGIQVSPIDLHRAQTLLKLRRDIERFVVALASRRSSNNDRQHMTYLINVLMSRRLAVSISEFNLIDREIDAAILQACGEPFLEATLRPLHTIFRRIGWLYHSLIPEGAHLDSTINGHLDVLRAIVDADTTAAEKASDHLMDFVEKMFPILETSLSPDLFDIQKKALMPSDVRAARST